MSHEQGAGLTDSEADLFDELLVLGAAACDSGSHESYGAHQRRVARD